MNGFVSFHDTTGWHVRPLIPTGRAMVDDNGRPLTWATKREAEAHRRGLERDMLLIRRDNAEVFRRRAKVQRQARVSSARFGRLK